jgi:hypothetical protein
MEQNYMNAGPMFFTSIDQIINWVIQLGFTTNEGELLKVLNETKKQGYEIQKPEPEPLTSEDFESVPEEAGCAGCYFEESDCGETMLSMVLEMKFGPCAGRIYKLKSDK